MVKRKNTKRSKVKKKKKLSEDDRQRRKFDRGGRIEAYTFGEAQRSKRWP